jgi:hypothetical protein
MGSLGKNCGKLFAEKVVKICIKVYTFLYTNT